MTVRSLTIALLFTIITLTPTVATAKNLVIHAGTLLAIPGTEPATRQTVIINGNRIEAVLDGYREPGAEDQYLDLKDQFVLPGLMDMHVHLLLELGPGSQSNQLRNSRMLSAMHGVANARKTLLAGFTTVRDLGSDPESIYGLRDAVKNKLIPGPRVFAAGKALSATGGHADVDGLRPDLMKLWSSDAVCDGAVSCRQVTRNAIKYGADWIKVTATGGVLSDAATGLGVQMTDDELSEIVRTAHSLGRRVAAHAHGTDGINAALRAGVDSIDHGTFLDKSSVKLFKQNNATLVATLMPGHFVIQNMDSNPFFTDAIKRKARAASAQSKESFRLAMESGVNIAFGTDTGVTPHGDNAIELELMVAAGMTPMAALKSATVNTAQLLQVSDTLGTIEPGKFADIIAVRGNPLDDIKVMQNVVTVVGDGVIHSAQ